MSPHNVWMVGCGGDGDDDFRDDGLTASSYHHVAAGKGCKRVGSWRTSQCRNPCLHPCLMLLRDSGEMVVTGREELNWVIKGIS